jgi:hypothetical protein
MGGIHRICLFVHLAHLSGLVRFEPSSEEIVMQDQINHIRDQFNTQLDTLSSCHDRCHDYIDVQPDRSTVDAELSAPELRLIANTMDRLHTVVEADKPSNETLEAALDRVAKEVRGEETHYVVVESGRHIQLDGYFDADELRRAADRLDELKARFPDA